MIARFHYDRQTLGRFVNEEGGIETAEITSHIEECELCQARLESLFADGLTMDVAGELLRDPIVDIGKSPVCPDQEKIRANPATFLQPTEHPGSLGRFARFEIMEILGRGGMGIVMRGYDTSLDRHCAVKVLAPELATSAAARKRFSREAKSAAAVVHAHVVPIQTVDEHADLPYLVMPVVGGKSLQQRVESDGPLSLIETVRIAMQVAEGLAAAHAQGLVHRDIKPANILLENGVERVQITDFGLARAVDDASMTRSGVIAGTPQYMSPEQAHGDEIDHRSDLFSLGSVMYFMLTGRSPFRAETTMGVLNRIGNDQPRSLRSINAGVPDWMEQIVGKLLSKSPEDRYPAATDVATLLQEWHAHLQQPEIVVRPSEPTAPVAGPATLPILAASGGRSRIYGLLVALSLFGVFALAGILIVLELKKGTLTIESEVDDVAIRIVKGDETVRQLTVNQSGETVRISAGNYVVKIDGPTDGIDIENGHVLIHRGDREIAKIVRSDVSVQNPLSGSLQPIEIAIGESQFAEGDQIEIQTVTSSGDGFEVGATVTVKGVYTLESADTADLCFYSTTTLKAGEKPVATPIQPSQRVEAKRGTHKFTLSKVVRKIGRPHITFYDRTTGNGIGGVYFSEIEHVVSGTLGFNSIANPTKADPASRMLAALQSEHQELRNVYHQAVSEAADEAESNRVRNEMDPREIMPAKYLAFEEQHRGTDVGLKALIEAAKPAAFFLVDPASRAGRARVEAANRVLKHYVDHQGLDEYETYFSSGPSFLQPGGYLQTLGEKSPHPETRAEALIAQLVEGNRCLTGESQLPAIIRRNRESLTSEDDDSPQAKIELLNMLKKLEGMDFNQLRADLNDKLARLADDYSDVRVQRYGTGGVAAIRLSHAINRVTPGAKAPAIEATDVNGRPFQSSMLSGKVVVLIFGEGHNDDYKEMYGPIRQLVAKYSSAPMQVVGIIATDDHESLRAASQRGDLNFTVIPQPLFDAPLSLDWGIDAYPSVYLIDAEGILQPEMKMLNYGAGGYDTRDIDDKIAELLKASTYAQVGSPMTFDVAKFASRPTKVRDEQDESSYCLVWDSADKVSLRQEFANTLDLELKTRSAVNALLSEIWAKYVDDEYDRTDYSRAADGHLIAEIGDISMDRNGLANEFWSKLGGIVSDAQREQIFDAFKTRSDRAFDEIWKSRSHAYPTLLGWSKDNSPVRVEITKHSKGFHWYVRAGRHGVTGEGEGLPPELEHYFILGNEALRAKKDP
ncbi:protein kinase [Stieleria sp. TO1_6]|uniref:protein kinase domain-containing protein n=1 Tax=Stieleria tagensis TaxID=2956795 RepID=UPI00209BAA7E|nr:protein kinase [Stieleria tagensis]MCO8123516.1 protein kinase [Stieleria tagensis]